MIDAGAKTLTKDVPTYLAGHGAIPELDAVVARVSDYHGVVELPDGAAMPDIGRIVVVVPNHICPVVDLFVGFGGVVSRQKVKEQADAFVQVNSLAPILPLAAGITAYGRVIGTAHQAVFERGLQLLNTDGVTIQAEELRAAYEQAFVKGKTEKGVP